MFIHVQYKPFKCDVEYCDKTFATNDDFKKHKSLHLREKRFKCSVNSCLKSFTTNHCLRQHKSRDHSIDPQFKCDYNDCSKQFGSASRAARSGWHSRTVRLSDQKIAYVRPRGNCSAGQVIEQNW